MDRRRERESVLRIRGHTLLCLQGFRGEGYSPDFVQNMAAIHRDLATEPDRMVEVVEAPDVVCGACPHLIASGCALNGDRAEEGMRAQDRDVLARLGLRSGMQVRWREILERIRMSVRGADLPEICGSCRWLPLGYCKEGIDRLRNGEGRRNEGP